MRQVTCMTDKGKHRPNNEDSLLCIKDLGIFMVADGVGGHNAGELASSLTTDLVKQYVNQHPLSPDDKPEQYRTYWDTCLGEVNRFIFEHAKESKENAGMATTAILLYLNQDQAYVLNVGDSRAYLFRQGKLQRITEDHSFVNELMKKGQITKEEALHHPQRNMITRAIGSESTLEPDFYQINLQQGDKILLCTDGLYQEVEEIGIEQILSHGDNTEELVRELVLSANENGGRDNITVICVTI